MDKCIIAAVYQSECSEVGFTDSLVVHATVQKIILKYDIRVCEQTPRIPVEIIIFSYDVAISRYALHVRKIFTHWYRSSISWKTNNCCWIWGFHSKYRAFIIRHECWHSDNLNIVWNLIYYRIICDIPFSKCLKNQPSSITFKIPSCFQMTPIQSKS